ncbi:MAG: dolichol-phosphate mannosyltransferase [Parcubacteria group bacterium Gr01-1014_20]|nr:MAG: dolichol-phosphate mannosyltransferase [Parcubacteria group bacterium Gr01-1014_20]
MSPPYRLPKLLRFLGAGSFGIFLYYLILYLLTDVMGLWYMFSAVVASIVNYVSNFVLQKFWTFENKSRENILGQAGRYAIMFGGLFVANLTLLYVLVEYAHIHYFVAQVMITTLLTTVSYILSRQIFAK